MHAFTADDEFPPDQGLPTSPAAPESLSPASGATADDFKGSQLARIIVPRGAVATQDVLQRAMALPASKPRTENS
jgi:hypothetical protein